MRATLNHSHGCQLTLVSGTETSTWLSYKPSCLNLNVVRSSLKCFSYSFDSKPLQIYTVGYAYIYNLGNETLIPGLQLEYRRETANATQVYITFKTIFFLVSVVMWNPTILCVCALQSFYVANQPLAMGYVPLLPRKGIWFSFGCGDIHDVDFLLSPRCWLPSVIL